MTASDMPSEEEMGTMTSGDRDAMAAYKMPEYRVWGGMKSRCHDPNQPNYKNYGGRGIVVCDRWRHDFKAFLADMGPRPAGHSLDRINTNGNYEPGNCRWATFEQQQNNRRGNIRVSYRGQDMTLRQAVAAAGDVVRLAVAWSRVTRCSWPLEAAVEMPKGSKRPVPYQSTLRAQARRATR